MLHTAARATDPFIHLFPSLVDQLKEHEEVTDEVQRRRQSEASLEVHNQIVKLKLPNFLRFSLYFCCGGAIKCRVDFNYYHIELCIITLKYYELFDILGSKDNFF